MDSKTAIVKVLARAMENQDVLNQLFYAKFVEKHGGDAGQHWTVAPYASDMADAIVAEYGEAFDYLPWPWWKAGTYNQPLTPRLLYNVHIELVDVMHFALGMAIKDNNSRHAYAEVVLNIAARAQPNYTAAEVPEYRAVKHAVKSAISTAAGEVTAPSLIFSDLFDVAAASGLSFNRLMSLYFAKSALNVFRQKNGYNTGEYAKLWNVNPADSSAGTDEDNAFLPMALQKAGYWNAQEPCQLAEIGTEEFAAAMAVELSNLYDLHASPLGK